MRDTDHVPEVAGTGGLEDHQGGHDQGHQQQQQQQLETLAGDQTEQTGSQAGQTGTKPKSKRQKAATNEKE